MLAQGLLAFGIIMLLVATLLWLRMSGVEKRQQSGVPKGKVLYADDGIWHPQSAPLASPALQLVGKPDYLVEQRSGMIIPVEVKSRAAPFEPHVSHVMQVAAYCLLVSEQYGIRPNYGIIQYRDRAFSIAYTPQLEEQLLDVLTDMREGMISMNVNRDHAQPQRCAACGMREACDQRIG
jgi:CRISPR-associated exonuclease Cas4